MKEVITSLNNWCVYNLSFNCYADSKLVNICKDLLDYAEADSSEYDILSLVSEIAYFIHSRDVDDTPVAYRIVGDLIDKILYEEENSHKNIIKSFERSCIMIGNIGFRDLPPKKLIKDKHEELLQNFSSLSMITAAATIFLKSYKKQS